MAGVEAKAKKVARHKKGIEAWLEWCAEHPKASKRKKIEMFDLFQDSAQLDQKINAG